jgi:hypothetical protein
LTRIVTHVVTSQAATNSTATAGRSRCLERLLTKTMALRGTFVFKVFILFNMLLKPR